uniref:Uncharacterized protein n=1 Tax=Anopheles darlingi TaxID=43151 RepID=A0A2M4DFA2_ANODA
MMMMMKMMKMMMMITNTLFFACVLFYVSMRRGNGRNFRMFANFRRMCRYGSRFPVWSVYLFCHLTVSMLFDGNVDLQPFWGYRV